jgi:hypothetical protein
MSEAPYNPCSSGQPEARFACLQVASSLRSSAAAQAKTAGYLFAGRILIHKTFAV